MVPPITAPPTWVMPVDSSNQRCSSARPGPCRYPASPPGSPPRFVILAITAHPRPSPYPPRPTIRAQPRGRGGAGCAAGVGGGCGVGSSASEDSHPTPPPRPVRPRSGRTGRRRAAATGGYQPDSGALRYRHGCDVRPVRRPTTPPPARPQAPPRVLHPRLPPEGLPHPRRPNLRHHRSPTTPRGPPGAHRRFGPTTRPTRQLKHRPRLPRTTGWGAQSACRPRPTSRTPNPPTSPQDTHRVMVTTDRAQTSAHCPVYPV